MNLKLNSIGLCSMLFVTAVLNSQTSLENTRREIQQLENEIRKKQASEHSVLVQLEDINREIGLRTKLLNNLDREKILKEADIRSTEKKLEEARREESVLKDLIARRIVSMYKHGRKADWEILLSLSSTNQALVWMRYKQLIIENDKRNLRLLRNKQVEIEQSALQMEKDLKAKEQVIQATEHESTILQDRRSSRQRFLTELRNDADALKQQLEDRRKAYNQITRRIQEERSQPKPRVSGPSQRTDSHLFSRLKGQMEWPVTGKVVSRYGRQLNRTLKTETENLGIDIETSPSSPVSPPCVGIVKWVTWQRGMGNIVLIDHGGDYWTVYGYLDMVLVENGTEVDSKTVIGHVGDRGSLYGPTLHFQILSGMEHQNPENWLR